MSAAADSERPWRTSADTRRTSSRSFDDLRDAMSPESRERADRLTEHLSTCRSCPECTPCDVCGGKGWLGESHRPVRCGAPIHREAPYYADRPEPAPEVVMDANGAYWRRYPDHLSMPPVSDDNEPLAEPVAVYRFVGWESTEQPISDGEGDSDG